MDIFLCHVWGTKIYQQASLVSGSYNLTAFLTSVSWFFLCSKWEVPLYMYELGLDIQESLVLCILLLCLHNHLHLLQKKKKKLLWWKLELLFSRKHSCYHSAWKSKAREFQVWGQSELYSKLLSQKWSMDLFPIILSCLYSLLIRKSISFFVIYRWSSIL